MINNKRYEVSELDEVPPHLMFRPHTNVNPKTPKAIPTQNNVSYDKQHLPKSI